MGWIGNILIVIGLYLIGNKNRKGFLFSIVGEIVWCGYSLWIHQYDLSFICFVFAVLAVRNYWKWGTDEAN